MTQHAPVTIELRDGDPELQAISHIVSIIDRFTERAAQERMINYICERFPKIRNELMLRAVGENVPGKEG